MSSNPATETSSGTRMPASRRCLTAPMAIMSLAATIAVGPTAKSLSAALAPPSMVKSPVATRSGSTPWPASVIAAS